MAEQRIPPQERQSLLTDVRTGFLAWRTRDILIIAVVGLVFGLLLIGASYAPIFTVVFGPVFQWLWNGLWVIAPLFIHSPRKTPAFMHGDRSGVPCLWQWGALISLD